MGCGRYGPPVPPEKLAPVPISDLKVVILGTEVKISWVAPSKDIRGENLIGEVGAEVFVAGNDGKYTKTQCQETNSCIINVPALGQKNKIKVVPVMNGIYGKSDREIHIYHFNDKPRFFIIEKIE